MTDYDVGYRKPPKQSKFKKGETGNPRGRPKRPTHAVPEMYEAGMKAILLQEAYRLVDINEDGKKTRMPLIQVIIRRLGVSAAQGRSRPMRYYMDLLRSIEEGNFSAYSACAKAMIDYKEDMGKEFARRKKLNPSEPDPIPHPDDIVFNSSTGKVELYGPMTKEEQVVWDRIEETEAAIADLEGMLAKDPDNPDNKFIEEDLAHERHVRQLLARAVPDYRPRPSRREARQKARLRAFKSFLEQFDPPPAPRSHRKRRPRSDK
jgi:hypothetical protein